MPKLSAGLLLYRTGTGTGDAGLEVLIAHPGGPFWARKDDGAWSIPKGEYSVDDDPWETARREFTEELGFQPPDGPRLELGEVRQSGGKVVTGYAVAGDLDISDARSNTFEMEWPPRSGKLQQFPEVDRVAWVSIEEARVKLLKSQLPLLDRLLTAVA
ncbi:phosphohydrolase [Mycolicibacterium murale]|uniref:Phosphohydrolase n=1 Tax=Mycolicibacterium murale TaxID=182220 RepID=A0A7I9WEL7_9MYCO|nr:NUDIX domain-containing protein [Mycolicibacterium murale]MCV7182362.1 NUDIX domain-containing protein [Mycolicibacterium murale]GFG56191.1 phosphohydrolase [Mycolicibacterium murale]